MVQPVSASSGAATTVQEPPQAQVPAHRGRILIVEDEPGLAEVLSLHLEGAGFETTVCHDGLSALFELERGAPSLVLLDLHLPQVSGFRLIQLLKQRADAPRVPVMVVTALSFPEAEEAVRAGADDFITKPFLPDEVVTRVERLLERVR
ncbi:MAG TPA: response regulator transcription factor [Chloroflexota bacterium]|nr:response regulator transcription factor [Chloroflexota bacterium]